MESGVVPISNRSQNPPIFYFRIFNQLVLSKETEFISASLSTLHTSLFVTEFFNDHIGTHIDVAAADGNNQIARTCFLSDVIGNFLKGFEPYTAVYFVGKVFGIDIVGVYFTNGENFRKNGVVGDREDFCKFVKEHISS